MRLENYKSVLLKNKVNSCGNTNAGWIILHKNGYPVAKSKEVKYIGYCFEEVKEALEKFGYTGKFGYFDEEIKFKSEKAIKKVLDETPVYNWEFENENN